AKRVTWRGRNGRPLGRRACAAPHNSSLGGRQAKVQSSRARARGPLRPLVRTCSEDRCRSYHDCAPCRRSSRNDFVSSAARQRNFWTLRDGKFMQTQWNNPCPTVVDLSQGGTCRFMRDEGASFLWRPFEQ